MTDKKEYKVFERFLNIDLHRLTEYLESKHLQILTNTLVEENELTDLLVKKYDKNGNASMMLNQKYNIFKFENEDIKEIYYSLMDCVKEASSYYGYEFDSMNYMVRGWFNHEMKSTTTTFDPLTNSRLFHDHLGGHGAPDFHGYYSVNAEPSSTYYKVNKDNIFENKNVNNRLVVVENGYPHSRGIWNEDSFRITIAYDVVPFQRLVEQGIDKKPHWMQFK